LGSRPAATDELPLGPLPGTRYPDPRIEVLDKRFKYKIGNAAIERVCTGFRSCEGPVYFRDGGYLLWSDIPNNRIMRWSEDDGHVSVYRYPSNNSNGNTRDREGRLITCEHDARRLTRTEHDGSITGWRRGSAANTAILRVSARGIVTGRHRRLLAWLF
jgi:gluconolactonase